MMAVRDGLQAGAGQCALVNSIPLSASRSMLGVRAWGWPPRQPIQSFRSSTAMNRMLAGCSLWAIDAQPNSVSANPHTTLITRCCFRPTRFSPVVLGHGSSRRGRRCSRIAGWSRVGWYLNVKSIIHFATAAASSIPGYPIWVDKNWGHTRCILCRSGIPTVVESKIIVPQVIHSTTGSGKIIDERRAHRFPLRARALGWA